MSLALYKTFVIITRSSLIWKNTEKLSTNICLSSNVRSSFVSINFTRSGNVSSVSIASAILLYCPWLPPAPAAALLYNYRFLPYWKVPCPLSEPYTSSCVCFPKFLKSSRCILYITFFDIVVSFF